MQNYRLKDPNYLGAICCFVRLYDLYLVWILEFRGENLIFYELLSSSPQQDIFYEEEKGKASEGMGWKQSPV